MLAPSAPGWILGPDEGVRAFSEPREGGGGVAPSRWWWCGAEVRPGGGGCGSELEARVAEREVGRPEGRPAEGDVR